MVDAHEWLTWPIVFAAQAEEKPALVQLSPQARAVAVAALLGLLLLGFVLILGTTIGARWVRREARKPKLSRDVESPASDWDPQPWERDEEPASSPDGLTRHGDSETKNDSA